MKKKLSLYIGLIIISINTANGNLFSIYSYVRQRININSITPEETNICYALQKKIEDYIDNFNSKISVNILNKNGEFIVDINGKIPRIQRNRYPSPWR